MNILITAGGTAEHIDAVRVLTNTSTGRTGAFLADFLAARGQDVTLLHAVGAATATHPTVRSATFTDVQNLRDALQQWLDKRHFDAVIHAAAVSDYTVSEIRVNGNTFAPSTGIKLPTAETMELKLLQAPKLINMIKSWSQNPRMLLIGFKLTQSATEAEARDKALKVIRSSGADYVVHNDLAGMTGGAHPFRILSPEATIASGNSKQDLATALYTLLEEHHAACA